MRMEGPEHPGCFYKKTAKTQQSRVYHNYIPISRWFANKIMCKKERCEQICKV